jgi:hypothetical protein
MIEEDFEEQERLTYVAPAKAKSIVFAFVEPDKIATKVVVANKMAITLAFRLLR